MEKLDKPPFIGDPYLVMTCLGIKIRDGKLSSGLRPTRWELMGGLYESLGRSIKIPRPRLVGRKVNEENT